MILDCASHDETSPILATIAPICARITLTASRMIQNHLFALLLSRSAEIKVRFLSVRVSSHTYSNQIRRRFDISVFVSCLQRQTLCAHHCSSLPRKNEKCFQLDFCNLILENILFDFILITINYIYYTCFAIRIYFSL